MPRDTATAGASTAKGSVPSSLAKGDACLFCRRRRIRCCATKPTCTNCRKQNRACEYVTTRPVSHVKALKDKIAGLEALLQGGGSGLGAHRDVGAEGVPRESQSHSGPPSDPIATNSHPISTSTGPIADSYTFEQASNLNAAPEFAIPMDVPQPSHQIDQVNQYLAGPAMNLNGYNVEEIFDYSVLNPAWRALADQLQNTVEGLLTQPAEQLDIPPNTNSSLNDDTGVPTELTLFLNSPSTPYVPHEARQYSRSAPLHAPSQIYSSGPALDTQSAFAGIGTPEDDADLAMVGGWFDAADVPLLARDHLLQLFFSNLRVLGQAFCVSRFYASLTLPSNQRPHPCLLYAMYLVASKASPSPAIRALEPHFHSIAARQLNEAIAHADRLFDAVRAGTILAVYYFSLARYLEGFSMTGTAAWLGVACGLNQIPSSIHRPTTVPNDRRSELTALLRRRSYVLLPPADPLELGERIWAFWTLYTIDRCSSISSQWSPAIPDNLIATPFPRPLNQYSEPSADPDATINSLYDPSSPVRVPISTLNDGIASTILRLKALSVLERAAKLQYLSPEPGWLEALQASTSSSFANSASSDTNIDDFLLFQGIVQEQAPDGPAYEQVRAALMRIEEELPAERRTRWWMWDGKVQSWHFTPARKEISTTHFIIGCAWMFLYDVYSFNAENTDAVNVARRLTASVKYVAEEGTNGDLDVFVTMCWSFVFKILIREVKRLQSIGQMRAAQALGADVEILLTGLRIYGQKNKLASMQVVRNERYKDATGEDMSFMQGDKLEEEQHTYSPPAAD